ncbi:unannotated protein [freshwater metagenome]|jgi:hypothetical protein|uniref:Unannotated protein n=2 Tax=freshwater metagenome TaxID=449393 RepID=A0A6J7LSK7_9ZZZZ|nr:DUF3043 domain-containing protein [Actinomycetota bacterium]MSV86377.1 DUF3043 domain-containing protein [Actinomycetota bacterium]MSW67490.1 DUF3043 domain-containing protein [Actinomycetota bacterium]MSY03342.1 DUF3043 domain-containing protein [Actinomycetota bacterium]MSY20370.1 DUF3043 domain-containing protein [Actinomycetota bacterium]
MSATPKKKASKATSKTPVVKGKATPKRKDAEAKLVVNSMAPATNKEERRKQKDLQRASRRESREAFMRGDENALTVRDRGPARRFVRDFVDTRRSIAEYLLPALLVIVLLSNVAPLTRVIANLPPLLFIVAIVEGFVLSRRIRKEVSERFPHESTKGLGFYAWSRSTMIRRMRAPRPQKKPGDKLS